MQNQKNDAFILENEGIQAGNITVRLAANEEEVQAAQALRYRIFYEEQGAIASDEVKALKRDVDEFDSLADHLIVMDMSQSTLKKQLVGNYRVMRGNVMEESGSYYTEHEFNIDRLKAQKENIIELGRSCVEEPYRTKPILQLLWQGLAEYMLYYNSKYFIGCASFRGTDPNAFKEELSYMHHFYLAAEDIRPTVVEDGNQIDMNMIAKEDLDERQCFKKLPPLIKGYLRAGAKIGEGAWIDHQWGSIDVCMVFKVGTVTDRYRKHYERKTNAVFEKDVPTDSVTS